MDGERGHEASEPLPEELVMKIVAMVPFPEIFKGRLLSKSWLARFQPMSSLHSEEEKLLAKGFQEQVLERSKNWQTFSPVCVTKEDLFAYNLGSQNWQRLPPLRFLPPELSLFWRTDLTRNGFYWTKKYLYIDGAFLYGNWLTNSGSRLMRPGYFVANILTQKWRHLPLHPNYDLPQYPMEVSGMKLVSDPSSETYKLIVSCQHDGANCPHFARIYDSKTGTWSRKDFVISVGFSTPPSTFACLGGVHYGLSFNNLQSLAAFNLEEGTMEERILPPTLERAVKFDLAGTIFIVQNELECDVATLVVRNGGLLLVRTAFQDKTVFLLEIDAETRRWRELVGVILQILKST